VGSALDLQQLGQLFPLRPGEHGAHQLQRMRHVRDRVGLESAAGDEDIVRVWQPSWQGRAFGEGTPILETNATIGAMNLRQWIVPAGALVLLGVAYRSYGWSGVALAGGAVVMVLLLQFNRAVQVLRRAAERPVGSVGSAVMLNARLKPRATLMHVVAMTRAIGELRTPKDRQPEVFRWTDDGGSWVDATFVGGRLAEWTMFRPPVPENGADAVQPEPAAQAVPAAQAAQAAQLADVAGIDPAGRPPA
jgi:hypothetical protein